MCRNSVSSCALLSSEYSSKVRRDQNLRAQTRANKILYTSYRCIQARHERLPIAVGWAMRTAFGDQSGRALPSSLLTPGNISPPIKKTLHTNTNNHVRVHFSLPLLPLPPPEYVPTFSANSITIFLTCFFYEQKRTDSRRYTPTYLPTE